MSALENAKQGTFVLLQVGMRRLALPAGLVSELAPPVRLHTFPHCSPLIAGVVVRRGRIVPVYDAGPVLIGRKSATNRFYLIARRDFGNRSEASAIPVSGECELRTAEMLPPEPSGPAFVAGKLILEDEIVEVLDLEALIRTASATNQGLPEIQAEVRA